MKYQKKHGIYLAAACVSIIIIIVSASIYNVQSENSNPLEKEGQLDQVKQDIADAADKLRNNSLFDQENYLKQTTSTSNPDNVGASSTPKSGSSGGSSGGGGGGSSSRGGGSNSGGDSAPANNVQPPTSSPEAPSQFNISVSSTVCNPSLVNNFGLDSSNIIDSETCNFLNSKYTEGNAAGNAGDLYYNRDNNHVSLCYGWTPNPDCPEAHRLLMQHNWRISGDGKATSPINSVTVGQASYRGTDYHGIAYTYYESQQNAQQAYDLYTSNNLFIYPSLDDDTFLGDKGLTDTLVNQVLDKSKANIANTPYIISSKQITKPGTSEYRIHEASGSDIPFVKLSLVGLAAFKPEVKQKLAQNINANGGETTFLIPTLQMLMRYSHESVNSNSDYLSSSKTHHSAYMAHNFRDGRPIPAYSSSKMARMANEMNLEDVPPLVQLHVVSETFNQAEKLFDTPGAIARKTQYNTPRMIIVDAQNSFDMDGRTGNFEYIWRTSSPDVTITTNLDNPAQATIEFHPANSTKRMDVFVFVKKSNGKYYSVPGVISNYVHP